MQINKQKSGKKFAFFKKKHYLCTVKLAKLILRSLDWVYKPFARFVPQQLFRYACCGGGNMVLDWVLYFVFFHLTGNHMLAFYIVFPITLYTGFWLNKNVTFTSSSLRTRTQLWRYVSIVILNLAINYVGLKLFVEVFGWYPTPSKMAITLITVCISFFGQKYFSFRR